MSNDPRDIPIAIPANRESIPHRLALLDATLNQTQAFGTIFSAKWRRSNITIIEKIYHGLRACCATSKPTIMKT